VAWRRFRGLVIQPAADRAVRPASGVLAAGRPCCITDEVYSKNASVRSRRDRESSGSDPGLGSTVGTGLGSVVGDCVELGVGEGSDPGLG
jgi:hypothetical protein